MSLLPFHRMGAICALLILGGLGAACDDHLEADALRLTREGDAAELVTVRPKLQQRWQARRRGADRGAEARTLEALAEVTYALGDNLEALSLFESAIAIEQSLHPARASRLKARMAMVLLDINDVDRAERLAGEAFQQATAVNDSVGRALALYIRANVSVGRSRTGSARGDLDEALTLFRAAGDEPWAGRALEALGDCAAREGHEEEARRWLEESLALFQRIGDRRGEALSLLLLGNWFDQFQEDWERGRRYAAEAAQIARRTGDRLLLAYALDAIGAVVRMQGHFAEALPWHREALELRRSLRDQRGEAETRLSYGTALRLLGRLDEAMEMLRPSVAIFHDLGDKDREGTVVFQVACVLVKRGRLDEATALADRALALQDSVRARIAEVTRRALFSDQLWGFYDLTVRLRMQRAAETGDQRLIEEALLLSERARARSFMDTLALAEVRVGDDPLAARQAAVEHEVERLETQIYDAATAERRAELEQAIDARLAEYADLQEHLEQQGLARGTLDSIDPTALSRMRAALDSGTTLLAYYLSNGTRNSYVWVITRDELTSVELGDPYALEELARSLYASLTTRAQKPAANLAGGGLLEADALVDRQASELGKRLLAPIAKQLAGKRQLVIITDGALSYVPFGLLPGDGGAPLAVDRELYHVPSLTVLATLRARRSNAAAPTAGLAIYADPVFSAADARARMAAPAGAAAPETGPVALAGLTRAMADIGLSYLPRLPYTQEEASRIASLLPAQTASLQLGFAAQKQSILDGALTRYRWIHLATHGIMDSAHPERSGLVFSRFDESGAPRDGYLRLSEIYGLSLSADLVVLSACQTAVGQEVKRDGLISLTRGFLQAGAHRVLATLWPVDDRATSVLMHAFYRALLVDRLSPGQALSRAQRAVRDDPRFRAPFYWAGFELHGDWQP